MEYGDARDVECRREVKEEFFLALAVVGFEAEHPKYLFLLASGVQYALREPAGERGDTLWGARGDARSGARAAVTHMSNEVRSTPSAASFALCSRSLAVSSSSSKP